MKKKFREGHVMAICGIAFRCTKAHKMPSPPTPQQFYKQLQAGHWERLERWGFDKDGSLVTDCMPVNP